MTLRIVIVAKFTTSLSSYPESTKIIFYTGNINLSIIYFELVVVIFNPVLKKVLLNIMFRQVYNKKSG